MPIVFISQPVPDQLLTAYKPVVISVTATTEASETPPVVFCDVYINSVYFRTFFSSKSDDLNQYVFDIQDAIQEKLDYFIPPIDGTKLQINNASLVDVFVKIRTSKLDTSGLIQSEQIPPIPGTDESNPITGQGFISNKFFVLNAVIQNEENQNVIQLLSSFRKGQWNNEALPLTRRNDINLLQSGQSSYLPILTEKEIGSIKLFAKFKGETNFREYEKAIVSDNVEEISNPPTINIKWLLADNSETIDSYGWDLRYGAFPPIKIKTYPEDPDNDITTVEIFRNKDSAGYVSEGFIIVNHFDIASLPIGNYQFKAKVTDSKSNAAESNILNYIVYDTTPEPGTITLEENETVNVFGGTYFTLPRPDDTFRSTYSISMLTAIADFYEAKGMVSSELRIKFKDLIGYTVWRYNNTLITTSNYTSTEVQPSQLTQFNAQSGFEEIATATIIHEFEIYHTSDPSTKFTNYLQMSFE